MGAEQAIADFQARRWEAVLSRCSARRGSLSRLFHAWASFELGRPVDVESLSVAIASSEGWALHGSWGLWPFRKRVGVDQLQAWGLLEPLLAACWSAFGANVDGSSTFATEWVSPELLAFCRGLDTPFIETVPWQLGSAGAVLDRRGERAVRSWAVTQLQQAGLSPDARDALAVLDAPDELGRFTHTGEVAFNAISSLARREALPLALLPLGQTLRAQPEDAQRRLARELDQLLLTLDLEARLREQKRKVTVARVLFRKTPRRALDVVVARLTDGRFGTLARYLERGLPGEVWTEGTLDEALAAVPEQHFAAAVQALRG